MLCAVSCATCRVFCSLANRHCTLAGHLQQAAGRMAQPAEPSDSDDDVAWDAQAANLPESGLDIDEEPDELTAADEQAFNAFMRSTNPVAAGTSTEPQGSGVLLSDLIAQKMQQHAHTAEAQRAQGGSAASTSGAGAAEPLDDTMRQIFEDVGTLLQRCARPHLRGCRRPWQADSLVWQCHYHAW